MANTSYSNSNRYQQSGSRWVGVAVVVLLHVVVIYAFVYALGSRAVELIKGPIKVENIKIEKPKEEEPPPPPPKMELPPPPFVPPPEINIQTPPPAPTAPVATTTAPPAPTPVVAPPPAPPGPPKVGRPAGLGKIPNSDSVYPPISKRLGEEGVVTLQLAVGADGRVADCRVAKSSGFDRLDNAACNAARSVPMVPAQSAEGQPMAGSINFQMRFNLH